MGRPRREGERYPSGGLKPSALEREARSVVIEARMRQHGMTEDDAKSDLAGSLLGRLHLHGKLARTKEHSALMYEAGQRYAAVMWRYSVYVVGVTPTVQAQNILKIRSTPGEDSETLTARNERIRNEWATIDLLLRNAGPNVRQTMRNVCVEDIDGLFMMPEQQLNMLRRGLNAVIRHYGMT